MTRPSTPAVTLRAQPTTVPLVRPFVTAVRRATVLETVLVQATDDDGRVGWGEAPISAVTKATTAGVMRSVHGPLQDLVAHSNTADHAEALRLLSLSSESGAARMAVDCALHDLAAQRAGMPLYRYLGGRSARITTDMTLSVGDPATLSRATNQHVAEGFDCIKVKLDANGDPVTRMRAVREAAGPKVRLRVDANQAFTAEDAVRIITALEDADLGVEVIEQPVRADSLEDLAYVTRRVGIPIMADESVWTVDDLHKLIDLQAADLVNIKLAKSGGVFVATQLARLASSAGLGMLVGCMIESTVGISAAASFAASLTGSSEPSTAAGTVPQDLDGGLWVDSSPVAGGARYEANVIELPDAPGLGISAAPVGQETAVR
ncbi:L-Ala-D/L-Glu epimerase [Arthrobacter tecti]